MRTRLLLVGVAVSVFGGCRGRDCVPTELATSRELVDLDARPDDHAPAPPRLVRQVDEAARDRTRPMQPPGRPYTFLALSGGGLYGSFGVGLAAGWDQSGARPEFDVVTGISTGALMATFIFLGPQYDDFLRDTVVGVRRRDLLARRPVVAIPFTGAFFSARPITRQIEEVFTPQVMAEVAAAHAAGRRLYVGTTNLDSRRLIIWDMGAIASKGTPESLALYRQIVLASSSVPGAFPPVKIAVEIDGRTYEELHVDGGVSDEVIFRAFMVADLNRLAGIPGAIAPAGSVLYVVNNGKMYAEPSCVEPRVIPMLNASFRSVVYGKTRDELYRIYLNCLETGVGFRHTAIPQDLQLGDTSALGISREDQEKIYAAGVGIGRTAGAGDHWRDLPPGTDSAEQALPRSGVRFASPGRANGAGAPCYQR